MVINWRGGGFLGFARTETAAFSVLGCSWVSPTYRSLTPGLPFRVAATVERRFELGDDFLQQARGEGVDPILRAVLCDL